VHDTLLQNPNLLSALDGAMVLYDRGTSRHCIRVSQAATRVGTALHLGELELEALAWAGLLHDLGKLAVPEHILRKPGPLNDSEWAEIKRHPIVGADLLLSLSPRMEPIAAAIRSHHERWDGSGYPDGLAGDAIPLLGRIITLPDVFDAMTSVRHYRERVWTDEEAIDELERGAGVQFDPSIVAVFVEFHHHRSLAGA
jgi:putative nucleotidyltransferase with HDIG domain